MSRILSVEVSQDPDALDAPAAVPSDLPVLDGDGNAVAKKTALPKGLPSNAKPDGEGGIILTLDYPVELKWREHDDSVKRKTYASLHMKRLTGKAMKMLRSCDTDMYPATMLSVTTGISLGTADSLHDAMDARDIAAMLQVGLFFIRPGPQT